MLKYLYYDEFNKQINNKTYDELNRILKKHKHKDIKICNLIQDFTLGSLIDFVDTLDLNKNNEFKWWKKVKFHLNHQLIST